MSTALNGIRVLDVTVAAGCLRALVGPAEFGAGGHGSVTRTECG